MTAFPESSGDSPVSALVACDNLTDFVGYSRGLDLAFDTRVYHNLSDLDQLLRYGSSNSVPCLEHAPQMTNGTVFKVIILGVMAVLSLAANAATIYSIARNHRRRHSWSTVYALILHLAVADLLVTVFCIGGEAMWSYTVEWIWGNVGCKLFKFMQMFSLYLSTFVLVLIGTDRFIAVRYPMKGLNATHRCLRLVIPAWVLSFILSIPQMCIFHVAEGPFIEKFNQCVTHGFYTEPWQEQLYVSLSLIFMFLLPLVILIATYVSTVLTISRSERMFKLELSNNNVRSMNGDLNRRKLMHRAKMKSLRISVVIVAAFIVWWTPYYAMMIIFMFLNPDKHLSEELQSGIFFFGMSNSLVNPLIYGAFHLWPRRKRQRSYYRELSTVQRRLTPSITSDSSYKRDPRVTILSKNTSNTSI
ncbi:gonadotropin-releasing hormone receptor isoform X1 [Hylaeus volcanicus]|uniref:gonadotropin-releasing hormone receptor isoform X1 n=1 Tax=Hylaeus volcanicus TaxID=313075 RepID=UPI0023B7E8EB|nr:gonadotropin-releasing hormone receptor isoform X1 [Hylaeus volcanicus]XP_053985468.1 gonadotropin-releasing hormone receptor isoform X1 [Hylaeus volcanicus]XP_053985534.1 gonadotropin-releasing hormone receptor isoform X1 [Hylaeus volcanicus]